MSGNKNNAYMKRINLLWDGPFSLKDLKSNETLNDETQAYGIYQIYGNHPVYGSDVLLYIGKADRQTFATRINQERWSNNDHYNQIKIYIGKLFDEKQPNDDEWSLLISQAEKLLIYAHAPAYNSSNILTITQLSHIKPSSFCV